LTGIIKLKGKKIFTLQHCPNQFQHLLKSAGQELCELYYNDCRSSNLQQQGQENLPLQHEFIEEQIIPNYLEQLTKLVDIQNQIASLQDHLNIFPASSCHIFRFFLLHLIML
jgi:hypothetical protein